METGYSDKSVRMALDLVTHSEVVINQSADVVWPFIVEPNDWKLGLAGIHHAGEPGKVGEILAAVDPERIDKPQFFIKAVEMIPNRRRTIKLYDIGGGPLLGYATWSLNEKDGRTTITYDVYCESLIPAAQSVELTSEKLMDIEQQNYENNKARFDKELEMLKKYVESNTKKA